MSIMRVSILDERTIRIDATFELKSIKIISDGVESIVDSGRYFASLETGELFDVDVVAASVLADILASSQVGCDVVQSEVKHYSDGAREKLVIEKAIKLGVDRELIMPYFIID